jgi:GntR family transcriptional regulator/MocR family aminotransferase
MGAQHLDAGSSREEPLDDESGEPLAADRAVAPLHALAATGLLAPLVRNGDRSLERQLEERLDDAITSGRLGAGVRLPSTRQLASTLDVSRNVVASAYEQLAARGRITARHGAGTFVADTLRLHGRPAPRGTPRWVRGAESTPSDAAGGWTPHVVDLRVRSGALAPLPAAAWRRSWRNAVANLGTTYGDARGDERLRRATAGFVRRTRGVSCSADEILITAGASDAIALILRAVFAVGDSVAIEDPGYQAIRPIARMHGGSVMTLPVDDDGADVAQLSTGGRPPIAVHVTPTHQFPLGVELSGERRAALLAWAQEHGALVIENDYGGEFGFAEGTPPTLAALDDAGTVAYVGTFSRLLSPELRLGYVVAPRPLVDQVVALKRQIDDYASTPTQRAVAHLIEDGELERHLRRVRRLAEYKRRRLEHGLAPVADRIRVTGLRTGLHVAIEVLDGPPPEEVARLARRRGVLVETLHDYRAEPGPDRLLLGYGAAEPSHLEAGLEQLRAILARER